VVGVQVLGPVLQNSIFCCQPQPVPLHIST
jgi:hypothetical protein